jgi:hypothetical protein
MFHYRLAFRDNVHLIFTQIVAHLGVYVVSNPSDLVFHTLFTLGLTGKVSV